MRFAILCVFLAAPLGSQPISDIFSGSSLARYLELTPEQSQRPTANTSELSRWSRDKYTRLVRVQFEIAEETARPTLDALALGVRYVEVEAICRHGREKTEETRRNNVQVLGAAQKVKLAALEEAQKLVPLLSEAQSRNLMAGPLVYSESPFLPALIGGVGLPLVLTPRLGSECRGWDPLALFDFVGSNPFERSPASTEAPAQ